MAEITDGATYRFQGALYRATLEDSELSEDIAVSFQRHPINQPDDEPSVFMRANGDMIDTDGNYMGHNSELQRLD